MNLIAWSQNMTPEAAKAAGAVLVSKDQLFEQADILTIHLVLSSRTLGLVAAAKSEQPLVQHVSCIYSRLTSSL
jgi:phosphoglycerate dehydrogenase-like enzyme